MKLADFAGSTLVLYFYPKDGTPGCTAQACELRDSWRELQSKAELFGVSIDSTESHHKFIKKHGLPFPFLSDPDQKIVKAYRVWAEKSMYGKKYMGTERTTYLIGPDQKIKSILKKVKSTGACCAAAQGIGFVTGLCRQTGRDNGDAQRFLNCDDPYESSNASLHLRTDSKAIISKLPVPLQNAVIGELRPIKQIFLSQRLARIVLVGRPECRCICSAFRPAGQRLAIDRGQTDWRLGLL